LVDSKVKIGVLSLQGDFIEHLNVLETLSIESLKVKTISDLNNVDGLIIPGGESTTIKKLIDRYGFEEPIKEKISHGMSVWGTCAGLICIAEKLSDPYPIPMNLIDAEISRNWFGRQVDSFETDLTFKGIKNKIKGIFIRAPIVKKISANVEILSSLKDGTIVAIKQNKIMGTSFHPELSGTTTVHDYFIRLTKNEK